MTCFHLILRTFTQKLTFFLCFLSLSVFCQPRVWLDSDVMIGLPENAPREVDDALALMMALRHPEKIDLVGISLVTNVEYAYPTTKNLLKWYSKGKNIPVFKGSDLANDLGTENEATAALKLALEKEKLTILAIGPLTNIGTLLKNHPHLSSQIKEVVVCAGRTEGYPFKLGIGDLRVWDYNFETDVEGFRAVLDSGVSMVFAGFESSEGLLLGRADIRALKTGSKGDKWVHAELSKWQNAYIGVFGVPAFVPWDTTPLGYITHPQYFEAFENAPAAISYKQNDANAGPLLGEKKYYLEVGSDINSSYKVKFLKRAKPGFEEVILDAILPR